MGEVATATAAKPDTRELTKRAAALSGGLAGVGGGLDWNVGNNLKIYAEMARDGQIGLGLELVKAPIYGATWSVKSDTDAIAEFIDLEFRRQWRQILGVSLPACEFGFAPGEILWILDGDGAHFRLKDLDPRRTRILSDANGDYAGLRWSGGGIGGAVSVPPEKTFVFTHWKKFGNLYGVPRTERVRDYWHWCRNFRQLLGLYMERRSTPPTVGRAPAEIRTDEGGAQIDTLKQHHQNLAQLKAGGVLTMPAENDEKGNPLWTAELLTETAQRSLDFLGPIAELETMKMRGLIVPERVATQTDVGALSLVEAQIKVFLVLEELLFYDLIEQLNKYLVPRVVAANFGPGHRAELTSSGLSEETRAMLGGLVRQILTQPLTAQLAADMIDMAAVLKGAGVPILSTADQASQANAREARLRSLAAQSPWLFAQGRPFDLAQGKDERDVLADHARDECTRWFDEIVAGVKKKSLTAVPEPVPASG